MQAANNNNKKPTVVLAVLTDGVYDWEAQARIHLWMKQHAIPHQYHHTVMREKRSLVVEFENDDDAMMFKLTWSEYVF
jgi:23S rRNA maturation mini-RNase III